MGRTKKAEQPVINAKAIERIGEAVENLAAEVESLRGALDCVQDDVAFALENDTLRRRKAHGEPAFPMHITSMPRNPLAPDFGKRLNRVRPEDLPSEEEPEEDLSAYRQQSLFS